MNNTTLKAIYTSELAKRGYDLPQALEIARKMVEAMKCEPKNTSSEQSEHTEEDLAEC